MGTTQSYTQYSKVWLVLKTWMSENEMAWCINEKQMFANFPASDKSNNAISLKLKIGTFK